MKEQKYVQCILCEGSTFQEAVDKFNYEMQRLKPFNPTFERAGEAFLIYIKMVDLAPETIAEAKHIEGCGHTCRECDYCKREMNRYGVADKRKKYGYCTRAGSRIKVSLDGAVCDIFYIEHQDERKEAK